MTITNIKSISNSLIGKYRGIKNVERGKKIPVINRTEEDYVAPHLVLQAITTGKRHQYQRSNITFNDYLAEDNEFVFIKGDYSNFSRMMSNLINNAADAIDKPEGIIDISYKVNNDKVEVRVKDNGQGMPNEIADKIMNNEEVETTKENGHGIGMQQIKGTLKAMNAQMLVKSEENVGTEFILTFAKSDPPKWFAGKVELKKDEIVVVLDDDMSIHEIWKKRFANFANDITVKYFTQGLEAVEFINSQKEKDKVFLLADYELRNQDITGINVIEKSGMKDRHVLITNMYLSEIKDFKEKREYLKMFHKMYLNDISIELVDHN